MALGALIGVFVLAPPRTAAQPVRVLLVTPSESGRLSRQVSRFTEELRALRGPLVAARGLSEADAIVRFTKYRRAFDAKGESEDWWEGEYRLLTPPLRDAQLASPPKPFMLLVIGREEWQVAPALDLLAQTLARALGRPYRGGPDHSI
jgi:hypothetical protein